MSRKQMIYKEKKPTFQKVIQTIIGFLFIIISVSYMIYVNFEPSGIISVVFASGFGINLIISGLLS